MDTLRRMIGIPYKWGGNDFEEGMDCFHYAAYVRSLFVNEKQIDISILNWIFEEYPSESDAPTELPRLLCEKHGIRPRLDPNAVQPEKHLDLVLLQTTNVETPYAMGTLLLRPEGDFIAYMATSGSSVVSKNVIKRSGVTIHSYWNPTKILKK